ncbi:HlyU family transcriptional regulator [Halomonas dongshanensis]|uniref:HlyU family transcriptional regulator n=1 Tax=Halomonas dongshanensis TaxID=2890835 RepID=A0ABT2ECR6_9GAMM|nr:HlyU family transcriptional regulator [Halomonas dongshanensis]MCS2609345.1 HlyU family transcriptional regulator [Halomonas dongshanensis]
MFKKLFSAFTQRPRDAKPASAPAEPVSYKQYEIIAQPVAQGGQYRVSGLIRLGGYDGAPVQEHRFERSDVLPSRDASEAMTITKAQRFIDEVGEQMFDADPRQTR